MNIKSTLIQQVYADAQTQNVLCLIDGNEWFALPIFRNEIPFDAKRVFSAGALMGDPASIEFVKVRGWPKNMIVIGNKDIDDVCF